MTQYKDKITIEPSEKLKKRLEKEKGTIHKPRKTEDISFDTDIEIDKDIFRIYERCSETIEVKGQAIYTGIIDTSDAIDVMERLLVSRQV